MALLTEHEQRQVAEAIARVEKTTDAELVTVLAARADDYAYIPLLWASLIALVVPGVVHYLSGYLTMYTRHSTMKGVTSRIRNAPLESAGH